MKKYFFGAIKSIRHRKRTVHKQNKTKNQLDNLTIHLASHCNLNCWGCDNFSPLSEECYADLNIFAKDIACLSKFLKNRVSRIELLGGEPLLHPNIENFLPIARMAFPETPIKIVTNGLLLKSKDETFWRTCRAYNIEIVVTIYPGMEDNFEIAKNKAESLGVNISPYGFEGKLTKWLGQSFITFIKRFIDLKTSCHIPLDLEGKQSPQKNFIKCFHANNCVQLRCGRLYTCSTIPNVHIFNKYFNKSLTVTEQDSIDIHAAQSAEEILEFLSSPVPFCRFCYVEKRSYGHPWQQSKKDISEWTITSEEKK